MMFLLWIFPQVTPNAGKTSVYQETPTTWWAPTVCPCWSTTSEESNSWSVTERERMDPSHSSSAQEEGFAPLYQVLILSTLLWWAEASFPPKRYLGRWRCSLWFFLPFLSLVLPFSLPFGAWRLAKNNWIHKLMKKSNGMHDLCHRQSEKIPFWHL